MQHSPFQCRNTSTSPRSNMKQFAELSEAEQWKAVQPYKHCRSFMNVLRTYSRLVSKYPDKAYYLLHPEYLWNLRDLLQSVSPYPIPAHPPRSGFIGEEHVLTFLCKIWHSFFSHLFPYSQIFFILCKFTVPASQRVGEVVS